MKPTIESGTPICLSWFAWNKKEKMSTKVNVCCLADPSFDVKPLLKQGLYPLTSRCKELVWAEAALSGAFSFESSFSEGDVNELNQNIARKYL